MEASARKFSPIRLALVGVITIVGGGLALQQAIASITARSNPVFALRVSPGNAVASAARADTLLSELATGRAPRVRVGSIEALAQTSLRAMPINVRATRILGYLADLRGQKVKSTRLMNIASNLSKRDFATQLWHIENRVQANDVPGALRQYDIALRANYGNGEMLYPQLVNALSEPTIRQMFKPYFASNPPWLSSFISFALSRATDPIPVADMVVDAGGLPRDETSQSLAASFLIRLVDTGNAERARKVYRTMPEARENVLSTAAFTMPSTDPRYPPISWQMMGSPGIDLGWRDDGQGRTLVAAISSGERAVVARKLVFVAQGPYALGWRVEREGESVGAVAGLAARCVSKKTGLLELRKSGRAFLQVPPDCGPLLLEISASGGDDQSGANFAISSITLTPSRSGPLVRP